MNTRIFFDNIKGYATFTVQIKVNGEWVNYQLGNGTEAEFLFQDAADDCLKAIRAKEAA